jgi:chromosome segregation ATPase
LVGEKEKLLEKQSELVQSSSGASSQLYSLNQEVEALRRDKADARAEADRLKRELETSTAASAAAASTGPAGATEEEKEQHRSALEQLEQRIVKLQNEIVEANASRRSAEEQAAAAGGDVDTKVQRAVELAMKEANEGAEKLLAQIEELTEAAEAAAAAAASASASSAAAAAAVDLDSEEVKTHVAAAVAAALENNSGSSSSSSSSEEEVAALKEQLAAAQAAQQEAETKAASASSAPAGGGADAEAVKQIFQDIYGKAGELFVAGEGDEEIAYTAKDVLKRLRTVLKQVSASRA